MALIFEDTEKQYTTNKKLRKATEEARQKAKLYGAKEELDFQRDKRQNYVKVEVTNERTFEAAKRLLSEGAGKVAVLNFANSVRPGGGVVGGSGAQEESLCRCSNLYPTLDQDEFHEKYYHANAARRDGLGSDAIIYSPDVTVFKSDTDYPEMLPEDEWYQVDVITCAAPDFHFMRKELDYMEQHDLHLRRAKRILEVALENGVRNLVLGAFGCGAFRNDPWAVARAYSDALKRYGHNFERVVFAIYYREYETKNYETFKKIFYE